MTSLLVAAGAALAACDARGDAAAIIEVDSAGVAIVQGAEADQPLAWRVSTVWSLGVHDDDPIHFTSLERHEVAVRSNGTVLLLDTGARRVLVIDSSGAHVATLGHPGRGPGRLVTPVAIATAPDGTFGVNDAGQRALVRWDAADEPLPLQPLPAARSGQRVGLLDAATVVHLVVDSAGSGVALLRLVVRTPGGEAVELARVATVADRRVDFPSCGGTGQLALAPLFERPLVWDLADGAVAISGTVEYVIAIYEAGVQVRSVRRAVAPTRATAALAVREAGGGLLVAGTTPCRVPPEEVAAARGFAPFVPVVLALALAPGGELWVLRRGVGALDRQVDVFDRDGGYLGTLAAYTPFPAAFLAPDRFVAVEHTDDGVPYLAVYDVIR